MLYSVLSRLCSYLGRMRITLDERLVDEKDPVSADIYIYIAY